LNLDHFFKPRSIAVVGSASPGKLGAVLLQQLIDGGYQGPIFAVNPRAQGLGTAHGCASLSETGQAVDLVVVASPPDSVNGVLEECGNNGTKDAVIITSGFAEAGNSEAGKALLQTARKYGIRLVGQNCAGIVNTNHNLVPALELRPPPGEVALVSQSGALGGVVLGWASQQNLGISEFISYGKVRI